jgi:2,4-dienoyl-CoA reductase (NADPH2)
MLGMHLGYADNKQVSFRDLAFYRARAEGGAGAIVMITAVNDLAGPTNMNSMGEDKYISGVRKLAETVHEYDCKMIAQLFHGGRNLSAAYLEGKQTVAPSAIASPIYREIPREMSIEDIRLTVGDFGKAALRCKQAGIDAIEISCSVGYLLSQFLSPLANQRTDKYGGSKENRMQFPKEVI